MTATAEALRETLTAARADAVRATIARGWQAYRRAVESEWTGKRAGEVVADLHDALDIYGALLNDDIHPASAFCELAGHPEAKHEALRLAAQDVADWTAELTRVFPACAVPAGIEGGEAA